MSNFRLGRRSNQESPSANSPVAHARKRSFSEMHAGQQIVATIRRIANRATKLWKNHEPLVSPAENTRPRRSQTDHSPSRASALNNHTMRSVQFASSATAEAQPEFPFQIKHTYSAGLAGANAAPGIKALLPQVAESLSNKQGFVYMRDSDGPSPLNHFVESFREHGNINLGNNCKVVGAYKAEGAAESVFSPLWFLQVHDSSLDTTFEVPVTEVPFNNMADPLNRTGQLIHLKNCMDKHLQSIPNPYKDSVECPAIVCPQLPRLAQLLTAQEECLGRQFRGELQCREKIDWICAGEELLKIVSPELPRFVGEESADFESFFIQENIGEIGTRTLPYSIASHNIANDAASIRAFKRHFPNPENTASGQNIPVQQPNQRPNMPPPTPPASLVNTFQNRLAQRENGLAYKEPLEQMQCASQAVNSLLQHHAITASDVAKHLANKKLDLLDQIGADQTEQKGLMHPAILGAILNSQNTFISKSQFMGNNPDELGMATEQTPRESWKQLVNLSPAGQGKNWVDDAQALDQVDQIEVTAHTWLAAQRGTEMTDLLELVNIQLAKPGVTNLPGRMIPLNVADNHAAIEQLEQNARHAIQQGQDYPIIVRTGAQAGHYQTIVPDRQGNWLSLNAGATTHSGIQLCSSWCERGGLADSLRDNNASDILVPDTSARSW